MVASPLLLLLLQFLLYLKIELGYRLQFLIH